MFLATVRSHQRVLIAYRMGGLHVNVVVLGAGAVGGYFGGKLAKAGTPVTFLVREKRYQQLRSRGLRIQSTQGNFSLEPTLARSVDEVQSPDVVILAVKNYHLESTLPQLKQLVDKGAKVLPLLNGVKHIQTLVDGLGVNNVLGGLCYIEATLSEEGDVLHTSRLQDVAFGALGHAGDGAGDSGSSDSRSPHSGFSHHAASDSNSVHNSLAHNDSRDTSFMEELRLAFDNAQVNVKLSPAIMVDMWHKYLFLTTFSAITAATRRPIGEILGDEVTNDFLHRLVREAVTVAKCREKALPEDTFEIAMKRFHSVSPTMTSSLHRDLEKGLPLELDSLQGALVEMGAECGIATPCMSAVYALLHPYRNGSAS